jgi:hypothetical protein
VLPGGGGGSAGGCPGAAPARRIKGDEAENGTFLFNGSVKWDIPFNGVLPYLGMSHFPPPNATAIRAVVKGFDNFVFHIENF